MVGLGWNPRVRVSNEMLPLVMLPLVVPGPHFEKHCCDLKQWEKALVHHQWCSVWLQLTCTLATSDICPSLTHDVFL